MTATRYATPEAFKQALETRLRRIASETRRDLTRIRQVLDDSLANLDVPATDRERI